MVPWMKAPNRGDQSDRTKELEKEVDFLRKDRDATQRRLDKALTEIERLRKELEEALRSLKRQAAPFSKGGPKPNPKRPGRKPGAQYGERASRPVPARIDQRIAVHCQPTPCAVERRSSTKTPNRSFKRTSCG